MKFFTKFVENYFQFFHYDSNLDLVMSDIDLNDLNVLGVFDKLYSNMAYYQVESGNS